MDAIMIQSDLPYLEPLLMWLRNDEMLKSVFTDKSFFMPHKDLLSSIEDSIKNNCPAPRALWILPGDTSAINARIGCTTLGNHTFNILVFVQCIRDAFNLVKSGDEVKLTGQYMELSNLRRLIKDSVNRFALQNEKQFTGRTFEAMTWVRDQNLYPQEGSFLATSIEFQVRILNNKES